MPFISTLLIFGYTLELMRDSCILQNLLVRVEAGKPETWLGLRVIGVLVACGGKLQGWQGSLRGQADLLLFHSFDKCY